MADLLQAKMEALYDDEALRSHMSDSVAAIWYHAAGEYLRETNRQGGDLETAYRVAREGLRAVNNAIMDVSLSTQPISIAEELARR
jgi:hypothetical protein